MRSFILAGSFTVLGALFVSGAACTINTTNDDNDLDGSTIIPDDTVDAGDASTLSDGGVGLLGFNPSNIATALAGIDTSTLGDVDKTLANDTWETTSPSCAGQPCYAAVVTQSDGSSVALYVARSWRIENTATITVRGANPLVIVALDTIDVFGKLDASGVGDEGTGGGYTGVAHTIGGGLGGGGLGTNDNSLSTSIGGGGAGHCGVGGTGGGTNGTLGTSGKVWGTATVIPILGGSAGGGGELTGGGGGGAIQLVAGTSITIESSGVIGVNGGGGAGGGAPSTGQAASGGGSGGALLLEAPTVSVAGILAANGGSGGGNGVSSPAGIDGTSSSTAAPGGNAGRDPGGTGVAGGNGSASSNIGGGNGDAANANNNAAAGGGGAGYIRINTTAGAATITGTLSPAAGTCTTQGVLSTTH